MNEEARADEVDAILGALARGGFDFRDYRRDVVARRLAARLDEAGGDAARWRARLEADPAALGRLASALLVRVTGFFREPAALDALAAALPDLRPAAPLRAWVVGSATGEEAFSLAMLLAASGPLDGFEVLATDRDAEALAVARAGRHSAAAVADVPAPLRDRFLCPDGDGWRVVDPLRARVRFAAHDFLSPRLAPTEAVVAAFDLALMRNVLLYFGDRARSLACARLAAVVRPGGALVLGEAEALPAAAEAAFEPHPLAGPGVRLYRRRSP